MPMLRTVSAAALVIAAGLGGAAYAQAPDAAGSVAAVTPPSLSAPAVPAAPPLSQLMQAQEAVDAPAPPPPPPPPAAAPSVAVAAEGLAPAVKAPMRAAFAAPPVSASPVSGAEAVRPAVVAPVQVAVAVAPAAVAPPAPPTVVKVVVVEPAPAKPAAAPGANALVARRVTDAAGAFDAWTEKAGRIDGKFSNAAGVSSALVDTSSFQAQQLEEGAVAFGALVALQDPVFVQSAHELASLGGDHAAAAEILLKQPSQVMTLPGADTAAAFTAQALAKRAQAVIAAGKLVRQAAYSMQADPWAKTAVAAPDKRLAETKTRSSAPVALDAPASELLMKRLVELRTSRQSFTSIGGVAPTPVVTRALALAAMIVLGEADEAHAAALTPILTEGKSSDCLKMAKLNLFQCLSVAGPHYEDAFCVGQHGLGDAGQCIAAATGVVAPAPVVVVPVMLAAATPAPSAGVSVPIALLADGGPERSAAYAAAAPQSGPDLRVAEAAPARAENQPGWATEPPTPQPRRYAQAAQAPQDDDAAPPPQNRADAAAAYGSNRRFGGENYGAPSYASQADGYADPRQDYGRYAQPSPRPAQGSYGYAADDDDAPPVDPRTLAPQRGYWGYR